MAKTVKFKKLIIAVFLILLGAAVAVVCVYNLVPGLKKFKISVDKNDVIKTVYGWGSSACWWSQNVDDDTTRAQLAKLLYSSEGLGLNIYRYNIGGGFDENERTSNPWRRAESFYVKNALTGEWEYDFSRDANAYAFLKESLSYGCIDTVVLFANSPHYSFTESGLASGSFEENTCNLKKDCYDDFVEYFLTITEHFIADGIPVKFISPVNEPQWSWGGEWVGQEGCHYEPDEMLELMKLFAEGIEKRGLDVKLMAPESGEIVGFTAEYFEKLTSDETVKRNLGSLAYHSYWTDAYVKIKEAFAAENDEKYSDFRVDMTEWCELPCWHNTDDVGSAVLMAKIIANDMQIGHSSSWTSWVAVNQQGFTDDGFDRSDGLISANDDFTDYYICSRYNALAHFSKYVPTGSKLLDAKVNTDELITETDLSISWEGHPKKERTYYRLNYAAFLTPEGKTVLVISNEGDRKTVKLDVKGKHMTVIRTDAEQQLATIYDGKKQSSIDIPWNTITTVIFE